MDRSSPGIHQRGPLWALLSAQAILLLGNALTRVALPWFVLSTTGSAGATGLIVIAETLPVAVGGFFGGVLVDRWGHKRASVIADLASGATVAVVPLLYAVDRLPFPVLVLLVALGALLDASGAAARQALLPEVTAQAHSTLERTNAATATIFSVSILLGPILSGALIAVLGPQNILWIYAVTFAVSALLVARLVPPARHPATPVPAHGYGRALRQGITFLRRDRALRTLLLAPTLLTMLVSPLY